ncbi:hypothetical protein FA09DRAFT_337549, partial [Tilletiopsis washingtonensis]
MAQTHLAPLLAARLAARGQLASRTPRAAGSGSSHSHVRGRELGAPLVDTRALKRAAAEGAQEEEGQSESDSEDGSEYEEEQEEDVQPKAVKEAREEQSVNASAVGFATAGAGRVL